MKDKVKETAASAVAEPASGKKEERKIWYQKTYGVRDLLEWELHLNTGFMVKPFVKVRFEGGQITGFGVSPATFTTADTVIQRLIEESEWFKNGRIELIKATPYEEVMKKIAKK